MKDFFLLFSLLFCIQTNLVAQDQVFPDAGQYYLMFNQEMGMGLVKNELSLNPESIDILVKSARLKMMYGEDRAAMEDIQKINSLNPYALYLYGFYGTDGFLKVIEKQPQDAVKQISYQQRLASYQEMLSESTTDFALEESERLELFEITQRMSSMNLDSALIVLENYIEKEPTSVIALDMKSVVLTEKEDYQGAMNTLEIVTTLDPNYATAWYNIGRIERLNGDYAIAKQLFDKAIALRANLSKAYFERAMVNKQLDNADAAEDDYSRLIKNKDGLAEKAIANRGLARKMEGDFEGALHDLSIAIEKFPKDADLRKNRGNLYFLLSKFEEAQNDYDRAILLNREYAEAFYNRALVHYILGDKVAACQDLETSEQLNFERAAYKASFFCE